MRPGRGKTAGAVDTRVMAVAAARAGAGNNANSGGEKMPPDSDHLRAGPSRFKERRLMKEFKENE